MTVSPPPRRLLRAPTAIALQGALAACAMLAVLTPARGGAALYVPLAGGKVSAGAEWAQAHNAPLLGAGPWRGAWLVRVPDTASATLSAIGHGALLVAVPDALCGPSPSRLPAGTS